jgi:hypothetical protein
MRTLTKLSLMVGLALTVSTTAAAVTISLVQVGGTYDPEYWVNPGDTLILEIRYSLEPGDAVTLIDPTLVFVPAAHAFNPGGSTETGFAAWSGGAIALLPIATGDIALVSPNRANGWEKGTTIEGAASTPCVFGACSSLGTASFVLSGFEGTIRVGAVGQPGGTVILDDTFVDIAASQSLGTFHIMGWFIPEPSTGLLLALGSVGMAAARRRRTAA